MKLMMMMLMIMDGESRMKLFEYSSIAVLHWVCWCWHKVGMAKGQIGV